VSPTWACQREHDPASIKTLSRFTRHREAQKQQQRQDQDQDQQGQRSSQESDKEA
jgi:hypothetical protein